MLDYKQLLDKIDKISESEIKPAEELKQKFIERTKYHIGLVNKFAEKIGRTFPRHDNSKLTELLDGYCYFSKPREELTKAESELLDIVTLIHITNSPHHPEYWTDTPLSGFTRINYTPHGTIDATQMPEEYLEELCCDWCACSSEFKNSPIDWFHKVNGNRWKFSPEQQEFILKCLKKLWIND